MKRQSLWSVGIILSFCLLIGVVYGRSINFDYTYLDDTTLLLDQEAFLNQPKAWLGAFNRDVFNDGTIKQFYRPIMTWSLIIDAWGGENRLRWAHVSNLVYHMVAIWLVYLTLRELKVARDWAILGAGLMAVHPLLTQAVVWIPGRNDVLLTIAWCLSFISYLRFVNYLDRRWLFSHWIWFGGALLIKETAIILPLVCVAYSWIFKQPTPFKRLLKERVYLGWGIGLVGWGLMRTWVFRGESFHSTLGLQGILRNGPSLLVYFSKLVNPNCLSGVPVGQDTWLIPGVIGLVGLVGWLSFRKLWRSPLVQFGGVWVIVTLLPTLIPVEIRSPHHLVLEHRFYLPMIGLLMILAASMENLIKTPGRRLFWGVGAGLIIGLSVLAYQHSQHFIDATSFWQQAVKCSPHSAAAYANRGTLVYRLEHDLVKAKAYLNEANRLYPQQAYVHGTLGAIAFDEGDYQTAASEAAQEIERNRTDEALFLLGAAKERLGRLDEAVPLWLEAVERNPKRYEAHLALVQYYYAADDKSQAQRHAQILKYQSDFRLPYAVEEWLNGD